MTRAIVLLIERGLGWTWQLTGKGDRKNGSTLVMHVFDSRYVQCVTQ
jgi:hypothetical protein